MINKILWIARLIKYQLISRYTLGKMIIDMKISMDVLFLYSIKIKAYPSDKQSSMQGFSSAINSGLEAFIFTDYLQWVLFYTKMFLSCIPECLLYDVTQCDNNNGQLRA